MILRIVRMEFRPEALAEFHVIFDQSKQAILCFDGCLHLELHQDPQNPQVRYTYSHWESEIALNAYRDSTLFASVWPKTKALFAARPQAFSLVQMEVVADQ